MQNPILEIKNLVTSFQVSNKVIKAVDDVSFTLHKNEIIGIVGESGSGKSVTSLSIMGLIPNPPGKITEGEILLTKSNDEVVNTVGLHKNELQKIRGKEVSMIFQEPMTSLNPVFTYGNQVTETILLHKNISKKKLKT